MLAAGWRGVNSRRGVAAGRLGLLALHTFRAAGGYSVRHGSVHLAAAEEGGLAMRDAVVDNDAR